MMLTLSSSSGDYVPFLEEKNPFWELFESNPAFIELNETHAYHRLADVTEVCCYLFRREDGFAVISLKSQNGEIDHHKYNVTDKSNLMKTLIEKIEGFSPVQKIELIKKQELMDEATKRADYNICNRNDAENQLKEKKPGNYLLRSSFQEDTICLSYVHKKGHVEHFRLKMDRTGFIFCGPIVATSIDEILDLIKEFQTTTKDTCKVNIIRRDKPKKEFKIIEEDCRVEYKKNWKSITTVARLNENKPKNRYTDVLPFNNNLVLLESNTYINASRITPKGGVTYLCTQGPKRIDFKSHTFNEYWEMAWQENVPVMVMVTDLTEKGWSKCDEYWPPYGKKPKKYGQITVECIREQVRYTGAESSDGEGLTHRTFRMTKGKESRIVHQLKFENWKDHGVANIDLVSKMIEDTNLLREMEQKEDKPIIVHCSAGIGRTGTFVAEHHLCTSIEKEQEIEISVYDLVKELRSTDCGRYCMVQKSSQYLHIYELLEERYLTI